MNLARIGSSFALLILKAVEFGEDVSWEANVVVVKAVDTAGIVQQHVGIENEVFAIRRRRDKSKFFSLRFGQAGWLGTGGKILGGGGFIKELDL